MNSAFKPGDRVRLKDTVSFGTVVSVVLGGEGGPAPAVIVAWDGRDGVTDCVDPHDLHYVRPPPHSWPSYEGPQPFSGR